MTIGRICTREVHLAEADETVAAAAERMLTRNVGSLVVLDEDRRPVGILTDRDLVIRVVARRRDPEETLVRQAMTSHPSSVVESTPIEDALADMRRLGVRRLLVVGADRRLVGLVSIDDVLALLVEEIRSLGEIVGSSAPGGALAV